MIIFKTKLKTPATKRLPKRRIYEVPDNDDFIAVYFLVVHNSNTCKSYKNKTS